jgi:CRISPR-associated endonuclease/helicase Cas3
MLLAKNRKHGDLTLAQHLSDTEEAAMALFRPGSRWGRRWLEFFRLTAEDERLFLRELRVACLFHDIGKANEDFQLAVTSMPNRQQLFRHEHLSALVMSRPEVREWLRQGGVDPDVCTAAVLSHHLKASEDGEHRWCAGRGVSAGVDLRFDDPEVAATLKRIAALLGVDPPVLGAGRLAYPLGGQWGEAWGLGMKTAKNLRRRLPNDPRRRRLVAVKVGLIAADSVASGMFRVGDSIAEWVEQVAHAPALDASSIRRDVIDARLRHIGRGTSPGLHPFQEKASEIGARGLLLAACGAGKTLAAWAWAARQAEARPIGRIIFLYPTRGTATEGFRDYAAWAPEGEATLLHGTAGYELERMRANPPDSGRRHQLDEEESRLFALGRWQRRYFSATVDQFLSAMEHRYEALCLLPALADSAVIIDEVHSFDRSMFDALIAFLREFDVPVLCMTATLPEDRRVQLEAAGLRVFPSGQEAAALADLAAKERAPRYAVRRVADGETAFGIAQAAFAAGKRVLWVVNQVARAQRAAERLEAALGEPVLCYHSRFKLEDRQAAHQQTVAAFQQTQSAAIAVTTQVCEMSLDLDADVLITEEAPVTSLVQRFGRANRRLRRPGVLADVVTYPMPDGGMRPYAPVDLDGVEAFLSSIDGKQTSQSDLARAVEGVATNETDATGDSSLFRSGYYALPRDFRDLDEFARPCVLTTEVGVFLDRKRRGQPTDGLIVPVPRRFVADGEALGLPPFLGVAEAAHYSMSRGFVAPERKVS